MKVFVEPKQTEMNCCVIQPCAIFICASITIPGASSHLPCVELGVTLQRHIRARGARRSFKNITLLRQVGYFCAQSSPS